MQAKLIKFTVKLCAVFILCTLKSAGASHGFYTLAYPDTVQTADTATVLRDSVPVANADTTVSPDAIKSRVKYSARDSITFDVGQGKVIMYGDTKIDYESIKLKAGKTEIDWEEKILFAQPAKDSAGRDIEMPVLDDKDQTFKATTIRYNFDSQKGKITYVTTNEGEGYIHGNVVKKVDETTYFIQKGAYTTCSLDHPHFFIASNRLKVMQDDKIVTGPAYLVVADVPTPAAIPFGFFPNRSRQASGIVLPEYGESPGRGFYLLNGGYYFGISDYLDLKLTGDVYTLGSWALKSNSNYAKRYKYNGNLDLSYSENISGQREFPETTRATDFFMRWNHRMDTKARPNTSFSANVNAGTSSFYRNNISSSQEDYLSNKFQSSVTWGKYWKKSNLSLNLRHNQNTFDKTIDLTIPQVTYNINRFQPLKKKIRIGEEKWFEKIGMSYSGDMQNQLRTTEDELLKSSFGDNLRNGIRHNVPVSTSFRVMKYFSLTPTFTYNDRWYLEKIHKTWDDSLNLVKTDTLKQFTTSRDIGLSTSLNTRIYGMYQFRNSFITAFRHVITPNLSFSWRPDFSDQRWGLYDSVQVDTAGSKNIYAFHQNGIYGTAPAGKFGVINISVDNNFEMKVKKKNAEETTAEKKVKLFESLSFATGYNVALDSLNLSPLTVNGRTSLSENISVTFGANIEPYVIDSTGRKINTFVYEQDGKIGNLTSANTAFSFNIRSATLKSWFTGSPKGETAVPAGDLIIPFSLIMNYNLNYTKNFAASLPPKNVNQSFTMSSDITATPFWKINLSSGYDFVNKQINYTSVGVYRDLHCWEMRFNWVPFGFQQRYSFQINVKADVLKDLKLEKKRDWRDTSF